MNLPRDLQDCYFFYYSTCQKGGNCKFRHEPAALGHEEVCKLWYEGNCFDKHCPKRHMQIIKPRSQTRCYWEGKPGGCLKPHCVFQHRMPRMGGGSANPISSVVQLLPVQSQLFGASTNIPNHLKNAIVFPRIYPA